MTGNLATPCQEMANVPFPHGIRPTQPPAVSPAEAAAMAKEVPRASATATVSPQAQTDNYTWIDSMDALSAGAGTPRRESAC